MSPQPPQGNDDLATFLRLMGFAAEQPGVYWRDTGSGYVPVSHAADATHFCCAHIPPDMKRRGDNWVGQWAIVIDDVYQKRNVPPVEPSFRVSTRASQRREQWVYRIVDPDATREEVQMLLHVLNHEFQLGDPNAYILVQPFRLPGGRLPPNKTEPATLVPDYWTDPTNRGVRTWTVAELHAEFDSERTLAELLAEVAARKAERRAERAAASPGEFMDEAEALLPLVSPDLLRNDGWWACIAALHHESGGGANGLELAHAWSEPGRTYDPIDLDYQWDNLDTRDPDNPVRIGTIRHYAKLADPKAAEEIVVRFANARTEAHVAMLSHLWPPERARTTEEGRLDQESLPGLVGALTRHGAARAMRQTAMPAFVGALGGVAALMGDTFIGRYNDRDTIPHLYLVLVTPTGVGKEDTVSDSRQIAAFDSRVVFASGYASPQALQRALGDNRRQFCVTDEYRRWLSSMKTSKGNSTDFGTFSLLMELYNRAGGLLPAKRYAQMRNNMPEVQNPLMNFIGITTEESLTEALTPAAVRDGLLNRPIHFYEGFVEAADYFRPRPPEMPKETTEALKRLQARAMRASALQGKEADVVPDDAAIEVLLKARGVFEAHMRDGGAVAPLWNRADQNTRKLAVVLAVGVAAMDEAHDLDRITLDASTMRLAVDLVARSTGRLTAWTGEELAGSPEEGVRKRLIAAVRRYADAEGWALHEAVMQAVKNGRDTPHRMTIAELDGLVDDGSLQKHAGTKGKSPTRYRVFVPGGRGEPGTVIDDVPSAVPGGFPRAIH